MNGIYFEDVSVGQDIPNLRQRADEHGAFGAVVRGDGELAPDPFRLEICHWA